MPNITSLKNSMGIPACNVFVDRRESLPFPNSGRRELPYAVYPGTPMVV